MHRRELYVGLMSGTSLDGIDAALVDFSASPPCLVGSQFVAYPADIRRAALALNTPGDNELDRAARLSVQLADLYATAVNALLAAEAVPPSDVVAIGCHGQTVRHRPELGYTIQLVDPSRLAEGTGIRTVADFRSRDIAAGGQGAPLVPAFHRAWFGSPAMHRGILNIGGIANITNLPIVGPTTGFDTGPGNLLLDYWAHEQLGTPIDAGGRYSASGAVDKELLATMLADPYFKVRPPKSTGRDYFNPDWLEAFAISALTPADVQATLCALTARSVADALRRDCAGVVEVFVCGGGAHNIDLMERLKKAVPDVTIATTAMLGLDPDWVEAVAFAWLARCAMQGEPSSLPEVTGARGTRVLGGIFPA
ncbi:MAG: anhydro-N-acetylmuramic acid kinase [Betaproteobacteria bacterium]|nr:anhydro-N-acetylmuramic acid kinase [Betaproteobacteria bacterium]